MRLRGGTLPAGTLRFMWAFTALWLIIRSPLTELPSVIDVS
jgi:hypothetical protein